MILRYEDFKANTFCFSLQLSYFQIVLALRIESSRSMSRGNTNVVGCAPPHNALFKVCIFRVLFFIFFFFLFFGQALYEHFQILTMTHYAFCVICLFFSSMNLTKVEGKTGRTCLSHTGKHSNILYTLAPLRLSLSHTLSHPLSHTLSPSLSLSLC